MLKLFLSSLDTVKIGYLKNVMTIIGLPWRKRCCFTNLNYYKNKILVCYKVNLSRYIQGVQKLVQL